MVGEKTKKHLKEVKYKQKYVVLKENNRPQKLTSDDSSVQFFLMYVICMC